MSQIKIALDIFFDIGGLLDADAISWLEAKKARLQQQQQLSGHFHLTWNGVTFYGLIVNEKHSY